MRTRLLRAVGAVVAVFIVLFIYPGASAIYDVLAAPMLASLPEGTRMIATGVITPFMVPVKVTMMAAFIVALPVVLYQAWAFVAPGLYRHEKRLALPLIVSSTFLFIAGMAFCYFVVFRTVFHFIATFAPQSITPAPDIEAYLSFVMTMFMAFGITFEVPVAVVLLVKMGIVELSAAVRARLRGGRRLHHRGGGHAAGRGQPVHAGRAALPALRSGADLRPHGAAQAGRRRRRRVRFADRTPLTRAGMASSERVASAALAFLLRISHKGSGIGLFHPCGPPLATLHCRHVACSKATRPDAVAWHP